jgi:hypothetical protein
MAEVADVVPGWPVEGFRFAARELDAWCDGVPRKLRPGYDYPVGMDWREIKKRLKQAAWKRDGHVRLWVIDDEIHILMCPWPEVRS